MIQSSMDGEQTPNKIKITTMRPTEPSYFGSGCLDVMKEDLGKNYTLKKWSEAIRTDDSVNWSLVKFITSWLSILIGGPLFLYYLFLEKDTNTYDSALLVRIVWASTFFYLGSFHLLGRLYKLIKKNRFS